VRSIDTNDEEKMLNRYNEKLNKKVTKVNSLVVETGLERAQLIIEDRKQGKKSAHKTW
jgi:hypothetical protein